MRRADGGAFPAAGSAILFFPSGAAGPAFLVTDNFIVLKRFNNSDAYALAVAELSDRLRGLPAVPRALGRSTTSSRRATSASRCSAGSPQLGYKVADFDGHFDFELRDAVRDLQQRFGMIPDGHPSRAFLERVGVHAH